MQAVHVGVPMSSNFRFEKLPRSTSSGTSVSSSPPSFAVHGLIESKGLSGLSGFSHGHGQPSMMRARRPRSHTMNTFKPCHVVQSAPLPLASGALRHHIPPIPPLHLVAHPGHFPLPTYPYQYHWSAGGHVYASDSLPQANSTAFVHPRSAAVSNAASYRQPLSHPSTGNSIGTIPSSSGLSFSFSSSSSPPSVSYPKSADPPGLARRRSSTSTSAASLLHTPKTASSPRCSRIASRRDSDCIVMQRNAYPPTLIWPCSPYSAAHPDPAPLDSLSRPIHVLDRPASPNEPSRKRIASLADVVEEESPSKSQRRSVEQLSPGAAGNVDNPSYVPNLHDDREYY